MDKSLHIILCLNQSELNFYFNDLVKRVRDSGREFKANNSNRTIEENEDKYIFITPDDPDRIQGLRIADWQEKGRVYEHPRYYEAKELLESRIR